MRQHINKKNALWLLGTIFLGAIGSGVYEGLLKPLFLTLSTLMLDVVTLGLSSLRDSMYADIAKGDYERSGLAILSMITGVVTGLILLPALNLNQSKPIKADNSEEALKDLKRRILLARALLLMGALFFFFQLIRISYIVRASNHFDQMMHITAPFIETQRKLELQSKFAQMDTRAEYVSMIEELHVVAKRNGTKVPHFNIY